MTVKELKKKLKGISNDIEVEKVITYNGFYVNLRSKRLKHAVIVRSLQIINTTDEDGACDYVLNMLLATGWHYLKEASRLADEIRELHKEISDIKTIFTLEGELELTKRLFKT